MCGIAGIIGADRSCKVDPAELHQMCQTIVHRGPDDEGVYVEGNVGLGMRRLSIIDLSTGHQPIHNEDRTVWVVFNGEIYNFAHLRTQLEGRGHRFYTNSDTEVIVHLYEEHGADCVQELRGMFALALWDESRQRLLLARDRFGKKPLHYALSHGRLLFGSEIKAVLASAPELSDVNAQALLGYFYFGYIPDPQTAFVAIHKLPPGNLLEFCNGTLNMRQYWDLPAYGVHEPKSEEECLDELEHRMSEAVKIRLMSDVPLGALLSGGVDSSTVVALMSRVRSVPVKTFSVSFRNADFNEAGHAALVAKHFGTEHHEFTVDPDFGPVLDKLTHHMEEPFGDASMVPTYYVCQMARRHVTVALAGDGGDELFAGYDRYGVESRRGLFEFIPSWAGRFYRRILFPRLSSGFYGRRFLFNITLPYEDRYVDSISYLPVESRERSLFSDEFLHLADGFASPALLYRECLSNAPARDRLSRLQHLDIKTYLPSDILTKVDRMSMANSLELRAPFLDHVLAEWVTQLSPQWKSRAGEPKYILKKLAERLGVPRNVLYRPKQGFAVPLVHWLKKDLKRDLLDMLMEPTTLQRGYFNPIGLRGLIQEHLRGRRDRSGELWILLVFELWHRNFLARQTASVVSDVPLVAGLKAPETNPLRTMSPAPAG
jgi:asparagine synthase (glutamine-hydrolysing)